MNDLLSIIAQSRRRLDADAAAYIAAVETADGASLEDGVKAAINDLIKGLKADVEWAAFGVLRLYAGPRTLAGCGIPVKGVAPTLVNFVIGDLTRETGLVGNGSSKRIDSNYSNTTPAQNSRQAWVWLTTVALDAVTRAPFGAGDTNTLGSTSMRQNNTGGRSCSCSSASAIPSSDMVEGLVGVNRSSSANYVFRNGAASQTISTTSVAPLSSNFSSLANSVPSRYSAHRIAAEAYGASWTSPANIESRVSTYLAAIATAIA